MTPTGFPRANLLTSDKFGQLDQNWHGLQKPNAGIQSSIGLRWAVQFGPMPEAANYRLPDGKAPRIPPHWGSAEYVARLRLVAQADRLRNARLQELARFPRTAGFPCAGEHYTPSEYTVPTGLDVRTVSSARHAGIYSDAPTNGLAYAGRPLGFERDW